MSGMERQLLRPKELSVEPEAPDAARIFAFWLRTVEDFLSSLREFRAEDDPQVNAHRIIVSCLSPVIFPYVEDAVSYDEIVDILKRLNLKKKNNVYARHLLVSRKQSSLKYLQASKILAKECSFTEVSANAYSEELTRDSSIRQRLLEKDDLSLVQAYELADSLDHAQRQAISISRTAALSATTADVALESAEEEALSSLRFFTPFFTPGKLHPVSGCNFRQCIVVF